MTGLADGLARVVGVLAAQAEGDDVVNDGCGAGADAGLAQLASMPVPLEDAFAAGAVTGRCAAGVAGPSRPPAFAFQLRYEGAQCA